MRPRYECCSLPPRHVSRQVDGPSIALCLQGCALCTSWNPAIDDRRSTQGHSVGELVFCCSADSNGWTSEHSDGRLLAFATPSVGLRAAHVLRMPVTRPLTLQFASDSLKSSTTFSNRLQRPTMKGFFAVVIAAATLAVASAGVLRPMGLGQEHQLHRVQQPLEQERRCVGQPVYGR